MIEEKVSRYKKADRVTERKVGDTLLLVPFKKAPGSGVKGIMLKNASAQFIWKLCEKETYLKDIVDSVTAEFNVDKDKANCEIQALLEKLLRLELVICLNGVKKRSEINEGGKNGRKEKMGKT
jgi:hypothetical protein